MANEMRDRLVELVQDALFQYAHYVGKEMRRALEAETEAEHSEIYESVKPLQEFISDYIIADGWIRPPCKVGDHIYYVFSGNASLPFGESRIKPLLVRAIASTEDKKGWFVRVGFSGIVHDFKFSDFGKTVFLTKSEAEQKLKEMRGGNDL